MVSIKNNNDVIREKITLISNLIKVNFPSKYIEKITLGELINDGRSLFLYQDEIDKKHKVGLFGGFLAVIEEEYSVASPPPFLPRGLIPFDEDGDGNLICFDYRRDAQSDNPPIIEWSYKQNNGSLLSTFNSPPEFFPEGLVAFSEDGGGNYICFDYRQGKKNSDPSVVFWNHEAEIGKDVSFVAINFEVFLSMLKSEEEIEEELKRLNESDS